MEESIESMREQIALLIKRTPPASKIDTINKVRAFKKLLESSKKLAKSGNVESARSCLAELKSFYGV